MDQNLTTKDRKKIFKEEARKKSADIVSEMQEITSSEFALMENGHSIYRSISQNKLPINKKDQDNLLTEIKNTLEAGQNLSARLIEEMKNPIVFRITLKESGTIIAES